MTITAEVLAILMTFTFGFIVGFMACFWGIVKVVNL